MTIEEHTPYGPSKLVKTPTKSALKAVLVGSLVDIGGSTFTGVLLGMAYAVTLASSGVDAEQMQHALTHIAPYSWISITGYVVGCAFSVLGGYLCARISQHSAYRMAMIVAAISTAFGLMAGGQQFSAPATIALSLATMSSVLLGAWLGVRRNKASVPTVPQAGIEATASVAASPMPGWRSLLGILLGGIRSAFFLRPKPAHAIGTWGQLFALTALSLALPFAWDFAEVGLTGEFVAYSLPSALFGIPVVLFAAWVVAWLADRPGKIPLLAVAFSAILIVINAGYGLLSHAAENSAWLSGIDAYLFSIQAIWVALAAGAVAIRSVDIPPQRRLPAFCLAALALWAPLSQVYLDRTLWAKPYDENDAAENWRRQMNPASEEIFYLQPKLLDHELSGLKPGRKNMIDLYFVGAAGYSGQDVFMKEVHYVDQLFKARFNTEGHSVMLINNPKTAMQTPIASATSLQLVLEKIGAVMDRDEDVLFLFLTSHGSRDHKFSLDFWPMRFNDVEPQQLRKMLDQSGIKRRIIVVSACYSGGFIDALKDDNSLIITASAPDKNSFGCSNEADFTYFGKAYFEEALHKTDSFIKAFDMAKLAIAEREKNADEESSDPRIFIGAKIEKPLESMRVQHPTTPPPPVGKISASD